jgi:hypothetical protein
MSHKKSIFSALPSSRKIVHYIKRVMDDADRKNGFSVDEEEKGGKFTSASRYLMTMKIDYCCCFRYLPHIHSFLFIHRYHEIETIVSLCDRRCIAHTQSIEFYEQNHMINCQRFNYLFIFGS